MNREQTLQVLRDFKKSDGEKYGIQQIGLFGSVARNSFGPNSDIDVCVVTKTPDPFLLVHVKDKLEASLNRPVDIVRIRKSMNPFLKARIERECIYV